MNGENSNGIAGVRGTEQFVGVGSKEGCSSGGEYSGAVFFAVYIENL